MEFIGERYEILFRWARRSSQRTATYDQEILSRRSPDGSARRGILIGIYSEDDAAAENLRRYIGKAEPVPHKD